MHRRRRLATPLATAAAALMLLTIAPGRIVAADAAVEVRNYEFFEPAVTISVGDTVTWTFAGEFHSVTSGVPGAPDGGFDSDLLPTGSTYERTFMAPGTFPYFCQVHPAQMTGTIVVGAASPTPMPTAAPTPPPTPAPTPPPTPMPTPPPTVAPTVPPASATASPRAAGSSAPAPSESVAPPTNTPSASAIASEPASSPSPSGGTAPGADGEGEIPLVALIGSGLAIGALAALIALRRRAA